MSTKQGNILVIDDDEGILLSAKVVLKKHFARIITSNNPNDLIPILKKYDFEVVLLDMNFKIGATDGKEGLSILKKVQEINADAQIIMITAYGEIDLAVEAMKLGAVDFVVKPWDNKKLVATVKSAYQLSISKRKIKDLESKQTVLNETIDRPFRDIIGKSVAMKEVFEIIDKVAKTDANVLILGENGTGKELVARALHRRSNRANDVFMSVDLGAIPNTLFESELFGHKKGAFTDAQSDKKGRFQLANGGTLFLDEIGNLPLSLQMKLLSALQNRKVTPLGGEFSEEINIRLISATNMPLRQMVNERKFREDLLYRINTVEITIPPLRERVSDIEHLAKHFLREFSLYYNKPDMQFSELALKRMNAHSWPGNVRELRHIVERAVILCEHKLIEHAHIYISQDDHHKTSSNLKMEELEKQAIAGAIKKHNGNVSKAAKELGLGRTTLYRKMSKYDIQ